MRRRCSAASERSWPAPKRSMPASTIWSRQRRSNVSEMSCSRQISAIDRSPRKDASTSSAFYWTVNFRYLRLSLNRVS